MISVMIPTRERCHLAKRCLDCLGLSEEIEILFYVDDDDPQINLYRDLFSFDNRIRAFFGKRFGYKGLNECYNKLGEMAIGDWLMIWNDDCEMETPNWVEIIEQNNSNEICILNFWGNTKNIFPVLSRSFYSALGKVSNGIFSDKWVTILATSLGIQKNIKGIKFRYGIDDITPGFKTGKYSNKEVWSDLMGIFNKQSQEFYHSDLDKLNKALKERRAI